MRSYFNLILFSFIFIGCKKKDIKPTPKEPVELASNYFPLKVGNYWIYEQFETDTNHVTKSLHIIDSVYVKGETIINGKTYVIVFDKDNLYERPDSFFYYHFDNDKIIDQTGAILLSTTDYTSIFKTFHFIVGGTDTFFSATSTMANKNIKTSVKAGIFTTITYQTIYKNISVDCLNIYYFPAIDKCYSLNTGLVYETMHGNCDKAIRRHRELVRYHVN